MDNSFDLTITQIFPILSMVFMFGLGIIVLFKNKKSILNKLFFLISVVFSIWMFGTFMMFINSEDQKIIFWDRFIYLGVVFMPALQYHFSLVFTYVNKKRKSLLIIAYILSFIFLILSRTDYFVADIFRYRWGVHTEAKVLHHFFLTFFFSYIFFLLYNFYLQYKKSNIKIEKYRLIYISVSFAILNLVGGIGYLPAYKISIYSPVSLVAPILFSVLIAYAIIVHHFLDIKIVLRKYSVYLISLSTILILAVSVKYVFYRYFIDVSIWADVAILILGISIFPPIRRYYYYLANKYFFTSLYDGGEVIAKLSNKLQSTLELNKICGFISSALMNAFRAKALGILIYNEKMGGYVAQRNSGFNANQIKKIIEGEDLYKLCAQQNETIIIEELKQTSYKQCKKIIDLLTGLKIETLTPLKIKDKTIGIIIAGSKESGDMYNDEDLKVLKVIGAQAAIAIENALLYEKQKNFAIKLKKEVKKATSELRTVNRQLKKLDIAKSEFISIASHQLRTPLTIIKGYISMMVEGSFGRLDKEKLSVLGKVYNSNERLIQLVENLLNISRIESGKLQFDFKKMRIDKIVESVVEELSGNIKNKGLRFEYKKPDKPFPQMKIDEEKIRQVIINLIDNAVKYTKKGGITVRLEQAENDVKFCVSDTGVGIHQSDLPNLFQKFSRGKSISLVHTEGTGLGLYVGKIMIEAHHGKIWAESKGNGMGSRFCFKIPIVGEILKENIK